MASHTWFFGVCKMTAPVRTPRTVSAKVLKARLSKRLEKLQAECDTLEGKISDLDKVRCI